MTETIPRTEEPTAELSPHDLLARYEQAAGEDHERAAKLRRRFLAVLRDDPALLEQEAFASFMAYQVEPSAFAELDWNSPDELMACSEALYNTRYPDEKLARQMDEHAGYLLRSALHRYEEEGATEEMFRLMRLAPTYLVRQDEELRRLLFRANAFELRRVRRLRRYLYAFLALHVLLVLVIFPYLFINAENGRLERQVEELADVEIGDEGYQLLSYSEGVYWSLITAASIGYGDITPRTQLGRVIAGILGTMGVITVGIVAGLVLDWITPRRIN